MAILDIKASHSVEIWPILMMHIQLGRDDRVPFHDSTRFTDYNMYAARCISSYLSVIRAVRARRLSMFNYSSHNYLADFMSRSLDAVSQVYLVSPHRLTSISNFL